MAGGRDVERAAALLRERPGFEPGLHLALAAAPLVCSPSEVPSLMPEGRPLRGYRSLLVRYSLRRIDPRDVEREARRQAERLLGLGLRLTHVNGHEHLHVLPGVDDVVSRLARDLGIPYVRVPAAELVDVAWRPARLALTALAARAGRRFRAAGLATNDRALGIAAPGHVLGHVLHRALETAAGVSELVVHPGIGNAAIDAELGTGYDWDGERIALTDPRLRVGLDRRGIRLVRPSEVARARSS